MQCTESVPLEVACSQIFLVNAQGGSLGDPGDSKPALSSCTPADGSNSVWQENGENGTACGITGTLPAGAMNFTCRFVPTPGPDTFKVDCLAFNAQGTGTPEAAALTVWSLLGGIGLGLWLVADAESRISSISNCRVEKWRGGLAAAYLLPALSFAGAALASPCSTFFAGSTRMDVIATQGRPLRFFVSRPKDGIVRFVLCPPGRR